jgi:hypothetical protein
LTKDIAHLIRTLYDLHSLDVMSAIFRDALVTLIKHSDTETFAKLVENGNQVTVTNTAASSIRNESNVFSCPSIAATASAAIQLREYKLARQTSPEPATQAKPPTSLLEDSPGVTFSIKAQDVSRKEGRLAI